MKKEHKTHKAYEVTDYGTEPTLREISLDAIARLEVLREDLYIAGQNDELEVNISDAFRFIEILKNATRVISENLNTFLINNGVHIREIY